MSQLWSELVTLLSPYVPGEQRSGDQVIKLNTNENPYPPSRAVTDAIATVSSDALRCYPDPQSTTLRTALANYHNVSADQVFVGNGSDEILALAFMAFFKQTKPLRYPDISYSFYPVYCDLFQITTQTVSVEEDFSLSLGHFDKNCGGIVFPNPNAPTARSVSLQEIEALLSRVPNAAVLIDEAYADFGAESAIRLIDRYPNLVVSRTFSKGRSLAGLRLGAAFGNVKLIEALIRVKDSFNSYPVDVLAQAAGIASLQDEFYYRKTVEKIVTTRERISDELEKRDFNVLPSDANFLFAKPNKVKAADLFKYLDEQNILVRYWDKPRLAEWLRISVGTDEDMDLFLSAVDRFIDS